MRDAVCTNDHVYGFAWRNPLRPQCPIVLRRLQGDVASSKGPDLYCLEQLQSNAVVLIPPETLKDLGKDEIARQDELLAQECVQRVRFGGKPAR